MLKVLHRLDSLYYISIALEQRKTSLSHSIFQTHSESD